MDLPQQQARIATTAHCGYVPRYATNPPGNGHKFIRCLLASFAYFWWFLLLNHQFWRCHDPTLSFPTGILAVLGDIPTLDTRWSPFKATKLKYAELPSQHSKNQPPLTFSPLKLALTGRSCAALCTVWVCSKESLEGSAGNPLWNPNGFRASKFGALYRLWSQEFSIIFLDSGKWADSDKTSLAILVNLGELEGFSGSMEVPNGTRSLTWLGWILGTRPPRGMVIFFHCGMDQIKTAFSQIWGLREHQLYGEIIWLYDIYIVN